MACASSSTPAIPSSSLIERLRFLPGLACNSFGHPPMLVPDDTWTSSCFMHSSATENDEKLSHLANERIHKISGIYFGFFLFSVRISHGMENRSWNLCWVRSLLHLVELTHKVEWSKGKLTHKEKLWCWYDIGWAQGKWEGKQDDDWSLLIVSSEALVVTPFWLFLFNLPA